MGHVSGGLPAVAAALFIFRVVPCSCLCCCCGGGAFVSGGNEGGFCNCANDVRSSSTKTRNAQTTFIAATPIYRSIGDTASRRLRTLYSFSTLPNETGQRFK